MELSHNQLQSKCFVTVYNNYPILRNLIHGNINNLTTQMPKNEAIIKMAKLKALGHMLPGRLDMELYFKGVLHVFDFKVGNDHIKPKQQEYINAIISQGGKAYEIRSVAQFIAIIEEIIK